MFKFPKLSDGVKVIITMALFIAAGALLSIPIGKMAEEARQAQAEEGKRLRQIGLEKVERRLAKYRAELQAEYDRIDNK